MNIEKTVLPGGVRVLTESLSHVRSVSMGLWLNTGSRDENADVNGMAHFFEHMLFKGTKNRNAREIAMSLECVGGHLNAFTGKEQVCLYAHVLDEHFDMGCEVICDLIWNPLFRDEDIAKEKPVVIEEMRGLNDSPEDFIHELLFRKLWPEHSLGRPVIGSQENIERFTRNELEGYRNTVLKNGPILFAAAGNISHARVVDAVGKILENPCEERGDRFAPPNPVPGSVMEKRDIQQFHGAVGFKGCSFRDERRYALRVLNNLLGDGMSSRLFQRVREETGLAYSVYSVLDFFADSGVLEVYVGTDPNRAGDCLRLVRNEIRGIVENGINRDELAFAKECLKGTLFLSLENTNHRMSRMARMELYQNRVDSLEDTAKGIDAVSADQVTEAARHVLNPGVAVAAGVAPKKMKENKEIFDEVLSF